MFTHVKLCDWTALTFGSEDRPDGQQAHAAPATQARAATAPPHKAAAPAAGGPWVLAPGSETGKGKGKGSKTGSKTGKDGKTGKGGKTGTPVDDLLRRVLEGSGVNHVRENAPESPPRIEQLGWFDRLPAHDASPVESWLAEGMPARPAARPAPAAAALPTERPLGGAAAWLRAAAGELEARTAARAKELDEA